MVGEIEEVNAVELLRPGNSATGAREGETGDLTAGPVRVNCAGGVGDLAVPFDEALLVYAGAGLGKLYRSG